MIIIKYQNESGKPVVLRATVGHPGGDVSLPASEADRKFQARMLLAARFASRRILVPSYDEWVGLNLLERDGELQRLKS